MKRTKLSKLLDVIAFFIISFITSFWLLTKLNLIIEIKFVLSLFISIVLITTTIKILSAKNKQTINSVLEKSKSDEILLALKFGDPIKIKKFWIKLFSKNYEIKIKNTHLELINNNKKIIFYYDFNSKEINLSTIISLITNHSNEHIYLCAEKFSEEAIILEKTNKYLHLLNWESTLLLLKKYNTFPMISQNRQLKPTLIQKIASSLTKEKTFTFIKYGSIIFIIGIILNNNKFYYFFAIIFYILALICARKNKITIKQSTIDI